VLLTRPGVRCAQTCIHRRVLCPLLQGRHGQCAETRPTILHEPVPVLLHPVSNLHVKGAFAHTHQVRRDVLLLLLFLLQVRKQVTSILCRLVRLDRGCRSAHTILLSSRGSPRLLDNRRLRSRLDWCRCLLLVLHVQRHLLLLLLLHSREQVDFWVRHCVSAMPKRVEGSMQLTGVMRLLVLVEFKVNPSPDCAGDESFEAMYRVRVCL